LKYPNVTISTNSLKSLADLRRLVSRNENIHGDVEKLIKYTPNYYPEKFETSFKKVQNTEVHIGCFGAIRPFKNHVVQAMAAIEYAASNKKYLKFYVNGTRTEQAGINCLKNLRSLFYHATNCELIELPWLSHNEFKELLHDKIDLALQCSFTETFNIVTADAVSSNVPVVVSNEIDWVSSMVQANFSDISDIVKKMNRATKYAFVLNKQNQKQLKKYLKKSKFAWIDFIQTSKKTGLLH